MQERTTKYQQLQPEDRMTIASMSRQGSSMRAMARMLGRSASTISRELGRNAQVATDYASHTAQVRCAERRQGARPMTKLDIRSVSWSVVLTLLDWKWSPQQIAGTLKRVFPREPERHVSHETIYTAIYAQPRGELRRQLVACLRQGRGTRMPRTRGADRRGQIPDMVSIHVRPPEVEDRVMPGHWEGDLTKGAGNKSSVGVLVERTSRLVLLAKMQDATAVSALAAFSAKLNSIAAPLRRSLTYDQGKELSRHKDLAARTGVTVYFCDPHSPWQRGTCENTNGLLRQYLPKGTDLSTFSQEDLDAIADSLNNRPRAIHGFNTPLAAFARLLAMSHQPSSSIH
jgi:IS30 family transposase